MFKNKLRRIINKTIHAGALFNNRIFPYDHRNTRVISGSPRSGTTWLAEVLCGVSKNRLIWEPLHPENPDLKNMRFSGRPFLEPGQRSNNGNDIFFEKLLQGKMLNIHTLQLEDHWHNIKYVYGNGRWVVKFVRGNGVVAYLYKHFNIPKPVVIIRHPCAVVASQRRFGEWNDHPYVDPALLNRYPLIEPVIRKAKILEEKLAITWACDVLAALTYQDLIQVVFYENLIINGEEELRRIFSAWGSDVPQSCLYKLPEYSSTWKSSSNKMQGYAKLEEWLKLLSRETIKRILKSVHETGVNIYNEDPHHIPTLGCL